MAGVLRRGDEDTDMQRDDHVGTQGGVPSPSTSWGERSQEKPTLPTPPEL